MGTDAAARCCRHMPTGTHRTAAAALVTVPGLSAGLGSIPCIVRSMLAPGGGGLVPAHIGHTQQL